MYCLSDEFDQTDIHLSKIHLSKIPNLDYVAYFRLLASLSD